MSMRVRSEGIQGGADLDIVGLSNLVALVQSSVGGADGLQRGIVSLRQHRSARPSEQTHVFVDNEDFTLIGNHVVRQKWVMVELE